MNSEMAPSGPVHKYPFSFEPGYSSSLIGHETLLWPIRSREFERFWKWFAKSECPGALPVLAVNFHHEHSIVPTSCPWVSEDRIRVDWDSDFFYDNKRVFFSSISF